MHKRFYGLDIKMEMVILEKLSGDPCINNKIARLVTGDRWISQMKITAADSKSEKNTGFTCYLHN